MDCPKCGHSNKDSSKFCNECGLEFSANSFESTKDASIDKKIDKIQRYLPKGLAEKILSQKGKIEGERKQVTIMFCDMVNFTSMVERLGPDQAYSLMDQVYEILIHKVHDYEGTVNEMTGDGVMALFGAPVAVEDAPQRALRSALAIHDEIRSFNEANDITPPMKMRIGIHTGPVVVGTLGNDLRVEFKAVGDTVNLASRLEGMAAPESTYVTADTCKLTRGLFNFEPKGEKSVKGKSDSIEIFELISAKKEIYRPRLGSERQIYSKMVGRDKELNKIELQVSKLIDGAGSVINIIGEAGIGKSRLIAELKTRDILNNVNLLEGRAISIGRNLSYHPIIDLIKSWATINEDDSESVLFTKLEASIINVTKIQAAEIIPFIATLMGIKLTGEYAERIMGIEGEALESLIIKNVRALLKEASRVKPLAVVIDDLHWADASSIELLESLISLASDFQILFINVFRPNHKDTGEKIQKTIKNTSTVFYIEINLESLKPNTSEFLIQSMLDNSPLPRIVSNKIIERSGGNPFFIEEVVRSFIDEGAIVNTGCSFEVSPKIHDMDIPDTINDVLMARIDRLDAKSRNLIKVASVIGRNFFFKILSEVAETIEDIESRLSYLTDIQLIREQERMNEIEYLFKHALAQEAAYESILINNRKKLHLRVADAIEKVFQGRLYEFYGVLSHHYNIGGDLEKAEEFMLKAGEEASKMSASSEALYFYQSALELYISKFGDAVDSRKIADLHENIATAFLHKGRFAEALEYFDKSSTSQGLNIPKAELSEVPKLLINIFIILWALYLPTKNRIQIPDSSDNDKMQRALNLAWVLGSIDMGRAFFTTMQILSNALKYDISKSNIFLTIVAGISTVFSAGGISFNVSKRLIDYAKNRLPVVGNASYVYKPYEGIYDYLTGNWSKEIDESVVKETSAIGDLMAASMYLYLKSGMMIEMGEFAQSQNVSDRLYEMGEEYNFEHATSDYFVMMPKLMVKSGMASEALQLINEGIDHCDIINWDVRKIQLIAIKATILVNLYNFETAKSALNEASSLVSKVGERALPVFFYVEYLMAWFRYDLAKLIEGADKKDAKQLQIYEKRSRKSGKAALIFTKTKVTMERTEANRLYGVLCWITGNTKKALKYWNHAIETGIKLGAKPDLSRTYFEVGKRLSEQSSNHNKLNGIKTQAYLDMARDIFEELGMQRDLDQLDRFVANV